MERRKANQLNIVDRVIPPKSAAKTDVCIPNQAIIQMEIFDSTVGMSAYNK